MTGEVAPKSLQPSRPAPDSIPIAMFLSMAMTFASMTQLTPISGGYFASFLMLAWMVLRRKHWPAPTLYLKERESLFRNKIRFLNWGIALFVGLQVISALGSHLTSDFRPSFRETLSTTWHLVGKWYMLWLVISQSLAILVRLGWQPQRITKYLSIWISLYFMYCLAQRTWGLDWARGFDQFLGSNRLAYGAYRVSGLMSHPLTLTYNLMLILFTSAALSSQNNSNSSWNSPKILFTWGFIAFLCFVLLLISGSRFVLLLLPPAFLIGYAPRLKSRLGFFRKKLHQESKIFFGISLIAFFSSIFLLFLLGGSTWSRFSELFDPSIAWEQRWPRLIYWKIHWQLFIEHPIFGVSVAKASLAAKNSIALIGNPLESMNAHNIFLQTLADSGIIGFVGLLILFLSIVKTLKSPLLGKASQRGFTMILVGLLGSSMAQNTLRDSEFVFCLWMSLGCLLTLNEEEGESLPYAQ